ncbi:hypothetical protein [Celerinatantimonas sp. YJH-8]
MCDAPGIRYAIAGLRPKPYLICVARMKLAQSGVWSADHRLKLAKAIDVR